MLEDETEEYVTIDKLARLAPDMEVDRAAPADISTEAEDPIPT